MNFVCVCSDGVGRSGTFICIHSQLERLKTEGVVDFFQAIKSARIQRAGIVPEVVGCISVFRLSYMYVIVIQYDFVYLQTLYQMCHDALADFVDSLDTYANSKELV